MLTAADRQILLTDPDEYVWQKFGKYAKGLNRDQLSKFRIRATRDDPILFALIYFRSSLRDDKTGGKITLTEFHVQAAEHAKEWMRHDIGFMEMRRAWVAPRESGKSTWFFLILPAWALAHGHRKFVAAFADTATQALTHLGNFKRAVQVTNETIRLDFPDLAIPFRRPGGQTDSDRQALYLSRGGGAFAAAGIESGTLGLKIGDQRPDVLLFDDVEPHGALYTPAEKDKRLELIRGSIFPMNMNAVVELVGTVNMDGALMHDIVKQETGQADAVPEWVAAENIVTRYFPALFMDEHGVEQSIWPAKWPVETLQALRVSSPRLFAFAFMNLPVPLTSAYWSPEMFTTGSVDGLTKHILVLDPAVTTKRGSDFTGIAVMSWSDSEQKILLRHTEAVKLPPSELRLHVLALLARFPLVRMILVEANQGGDVWQDSVFHDMPVKVSEVKESIKKELRWAEVTDMWPSGTIVHEAGGQVHPFETQAIAVPLTAHDDVVDAVVGGVRWMKRHVMTPPVAKGRDRNRNYAGRR